MNNLTILVEIDFGLTVASIEIDGHLEFKMADNRPQTRMCHLPVMYPELLHLHNLKPNCVVVDVHSGHNPAPSVNSQPYYA